MDQGVSNLGERGKTKQGPQRADHEASELTQTASGPPSCSGFLLFAQLQIERRGKSAWRKGESTLVVAMTAC